MLVHAMTGSPDKHFERVNTQEIEKAKAAAASEEKGLRKLRRDGSGQMPSYANKKTRA